jgi:hypothetical protein
MFPESQAIGAATDYGLRYAQIHSAQESGLTPGYPLSRICRHFLQFQSRDFSVSRLW